MPEFQVKLVTTVTTDVTIQAITREDAVAEVRGVAEKFTFILPYIKNKVMHGIYVKGEGFGSLPPKERKPRKRKNV